MTIVTGDLPLTSFVVSLLYHDPSRKSFRPALRSHVKRLHLFIYNSLPSIEDASRMFDLKGGAVVLLRGLRRVILRHGAEESWGVQLLHKHFEIEADEKIVSFGTVSVPVNFQQMDGNAASRILGSSWMWTGEGPTPYEFAFAKDAPNISLELFSEVFTCLQVSNLSHQLGLVYLPHTAAGLEYTDGHANITLPYGVLSMGGPGDYNEVVWMFSPDPAVMRRCKKHCSYVNGGGHKGTHYKTGK